MGPSQDGSVRDVAIATKLSNSLPYITQPPFEDLDPLESDLLLARKPHDVVLAGLAVPIYDRLSVGHNRDLIGEPPEVLTVRIDHVQVLIAVFRSA